MKSKSKKYKLIIVLSSVAMVIIATVLILFGIANSYYTKHPDSQYHGWEYIGGWFNPFAEGNWWAGTIYILLGFALIIGVVVLWGSKKRRDY